MFRLLHFYVTLHKVACAVHWIALLVFLEITFSTNDGQVGGNNAGVIFLKKKYKIPRRYLGWGNEMCMSSYTQTEKVCMLCDSTIIFLHLQMHPERYMNVGGDSIILQTYLKHFDIYFFGML